MSKLKIRKVEWGGWCYTADNGFTQSVTQAESGLFTGPRLTSVDFLFSYPSAQQRLSIAQVLVTPWWKEGRKAGLQMGADPKLEMGPNSLCLFQLWKIPQCSQLHWQAKEHPSRPRLSCSSRSQEWHPPLRLLPAHFPFCSSDQDLTVSTVPFILTPLVPLDCFSLSFLVPRPLEELY